MGRNLLFRNTGTLNSAVSTLIFLIIRLERRAPFSKERNPHWLCPFALKNEIGVIRGYNTPRWKTIATAALLVSDRKKWRNNKILVTKNKSL